MLISTNHITFALYNVKVIWFVIMKKTIGLILIFLLPVLIVYLLFFEPEYKPTKLELLKQSMQQKKKPSVDHSKFAELNKKFERPQDVTKTCISCHNKRDIEVMATSHWRWLIDEYMEGRGIISLGKRNAINNHCISIGGSEGSCNRCHIGYGYDSKNFDFTKAENIDCLSCHDNSGLYEKEKEAAGYPKSNLDFTKIAQSVGRPKMDNCGYCHFNGGGGNNSKHGDLEEALYTANREVDVHLARDGANFECVDCHKAENHNIKGRLYTVASMNRNRLLCEDCHSDAPHSESIINEHTTKVACQTCHIPTYAKVNQTKTFWDWSKAGKLKDGKPYKIDNEQGNDIYLSEKGEIRWESNLTPEYVWFKGTATHYLFGDTIKQVPVKLNEFNASYYDMNSKIYPVKIMRTIQPYDPVYNRLVSPKLWDKEDGKGAFWKYFDWAKAIDTEMKYANLEWSGKYGFVETEMYWLLNHMVSPKEHSLKCVDCHTRNDSRLKTINDVYLPGRDRNIWIDNIGIALILAVVFGVVAHGGTRIIYLRKKKNHKGDK